MLTLDLCIRMPAKTALIPYTSSFRYPFPSAQIVYGIPTVNSGRQRLCFYGNGFLGSFDRLAFLRFASDVLVSCLSRFAFATLVLRCCCSSTFSSCPLRRANQRQSGLALGRLLP